MCPTWAVLLGAALVALVGLTKLRSITKTGDHRPNRPCVRRGGLGGRSAASSGTRGDAGGWQGPGQPKGVALPHDGVDDIAKCRVARASGCPLAALLHIEVLDQLQAPPLRGAQNQIMAAAGIRQQDVVGNLDVLHTVCTERLRRRRRRLHGATPHNSQA